MGIWDIFVYFVYLSIWYFLYICIFYVIYVIYWIFESFESSEPIRTIRISWINRISWLMLRNSATSRGAPVRRQPQSGMHLNRISEFDACKFAAIAPFRECYSRGVGTLRLRYLSQTTKYTKCIKYKLWKFDIYIYIYIYIICFYSFWNIRIVLNMVCTSCVLLVCFVYLFILCYICYIYWIFESFESSEPNRTIRTSWINWTRLRSSATSRGAPVRRQPQSGMRLHRVNWFDACKFAAIVPFQELYSRGLGKLRVRCLSQTTKYTKCIKDKL